MNDETVFLNSFIAPLHIVADTARVPALVKPGTVVMVVDDDPLIRESVAETLEIEGYAVAAVSTGEAALTAIELGAIPSAVILDVWLPGMGSTAFMRALRARPGGRVPVVVLTAWPWSERPLDLDADAYLVKPSEASTIVRAVDRLVRARPRRGPRKASNRRARAFAAGFGQAT